MDMLNRLSSYHAASFARAGKLSLFYAGVNSFKRAEKRYKWWGELSEGGYLGGEEGIATGRRLRQEEECRESGRLQLVRNIRMKRG